MGYEIKPGKYLAIRPKGKERFVRLKSLGENYTEDAIKYRILAQQRPAYPPMSARIVVKHARYRGDFKLMKPTIKGLRALYFYYLFLLRKARSQPSSQVSFLLREDLRRMDEISGQAKLLCKYRVETKERLIGVISGLNEGRDRFTTERRIMGYRKKYSTDAKKLNGYEEEGRAIATRLFTVRKELKLAESVLFRSEMIQKKLEHFVMQSAEKDKPLQKNKHIR